MEHLTVLLVEDDQEDAQALWERLAGMRRHQGRGVTLDVVHADCLTAGLQQLSAGGIDVVLLDLMLPDSRGIETLHRVREAAPQIPVVVMTGLEDAEMAVQAMQAGSQDYLVKQHVNEQLLLHAVCYAVERQAMHVALNASERRFHQLIHSNADGIVVVDREGTLRFVNPAAEVLFGYPATMLVGMQFGFPVVVGETTELDIVRPDQEIVVEMRVVETLWEGDIAYLASLRDITDRKRAEASLRYREELLRQAQKMEAIGRLAGGVAHDFNNLLTAIIGYSDILLMRVDRDEPVHRYVDRISKAANRAALITRQLLAFSRRQLAQPQLLNVNSAVSDIQKMLQPLIGEDIEIITCLTPELGQVYVDAGHIEQIVMNLVLNARDAMPQGGQLTILTANIELTEAQPCRYFGAPPGPYVMLQVTDTGEGMDTQTLTRLFEPFYTTKDPGQGTGLGLAVVYGILQQAGGEIEVISEQGKGTTFKVYLPRVAGAVPLGPSHEVRVTLPHGLETVLVVEDEEIVRVIMHDTLQMQGYHVLTAADVQDAMRLCEQHNGPIHLLVTDMVMPNMSGQELAERLTAVRTDIRVLFISGHSDDTLARRGLVNGRVAFLPKPFTPDTLVHTVRHVLDAPGSTMEQGHQQVPRKPCRHASASTKATSVKRPRH
jgi:PAS domain S-box-containing protein